MIKAAHRLLPPLLRLLLGDRLGCWCRLRLLLWSLSLADVDVACRQHATDTLTRSDLILGIIVINCELNLLVFGGIVLNIGERHRIEIELLVDGFELLVELLGLPEGLLYYLIQVRFKVLTLLIA